MANHFLAAVLLLVLCFAANSRCASDPPIYHFIIQRRGGDFALNRTADMDYLAQQLQIAESRFNLTQREVRGNKVVRAPKAKAVGGGESQKLLGEVGRNNSWYTTLRLGGAHQPVEVDIDMLTADFAITSTSSSEGTKFEEFFSTTYQASKEHAFPNCLLPKDMLHLPRTHEPFALSFPHCKPSKQSLETLGPSGGILGLAPSQSLRQISSSGLIQQLLESGKIKNGVFSITLLNGHEGILSVGGTAADSMVMIEDRITNFLGRTSESFSPEEVHNAEQDAADLANGAPQELLNDFDFDDAPDAASHAGLGNQLAGRPNLVKRKDGEADREDGVTDFAVAAELPLPNPNLKHEAPRLMKRARRPRPLDHKDMSDWREQWKWSPVEGAEGWWQTLLRGVWTNGVKVIKNQPCVVDITTPFILAPPQAAREFYASVSGSHRLPPPYSQFYAFPCNNPPFLHVEFGGWKFPTLRGLKSNGLFDSSLGPNAKFSLGKVTDESGYCVGAIVETKMGVGDVAPVRRGGSRKKEDTLRGPSPLESGMLAGNGMRDVWVLGEPVFRGIGVVFDLKQKMVGFRSY